MDYICTKCHQKEPVTTLKPNCDCGGLWDLDYTPPTFDLELIDKNEWSLFRYRHFMPLIDDSWREVTLGEGLSPVVKLDEDVSLKMDYLMPTLSFKDRGAAVLMAHVRSLGVDTVVQDSSGNAGNSVAAYSAKAGIQSEIFVPEGTSPKKIAMIQAHGSKVNVIPGSRDHTAEVTREKVATEKAFYASHVYNPYFYQGTKTYIYEVYEQLGRIPQHIFVPLGNGTLFLGVVQGLEDLLASGVISEFPQIVAVQGEHAAPIVKAVREDATAVRGIDTKPTLAEGIAIGAPMRGDQILDYIYKYDIHMITAPEDRILEARKSLAGHGVYCEHTSAAIYAAYWHYCEVYGKTPDSLLPVTGAGLKSDK